MTSSAALRKVLRGEQQPADLHVHYDLHRQCYVDAVLPSLTAAIGAPS
jgi:hypothetical protein